MNKSVLKMVPQFDIPGFLESIIFVELSITFLSQSYQTNGRFSTVHGTRMTFNCWMSKIIMKCWMSVKLTCYIVLYLAAGESEKRPRRDPRWRDLTRGHVPREWRLVLSALPNLHWSVDLCGTLFRFTLSISILHLSYRFLFKVVFILERCTVCKRHLSLTSLALIKNHFNFITYTNYVWI